jgi:hypothetical protein
MFYEIWLPLDEGLVKWLVGKFSDHSRIIILDLAKRPNSGLELPQARVSDMGRKYDHIDKK